MHMTDDSSSLQPAGDAALRSGARRETAGRPPASIEARLAAGEGQLAARMLLSAVANGTFPQDLPLSAWFHGLGEQARAKLVSAFAHYPCFACHNGQEPCDGCGGSGFVAVAHVCAACAGLGVKRCDFCSGSGLATYNVMPVELWPKVLVARATRAAKYLQKLAGSHEAAAEEAEAYAVRRLQDMNKLVGVLENALAAARQLADSGLAAPEAVAQFADACNRPAAAGMAAVRDLLRHLAQLYRNQAQILPPVDAENADAKAEFYEDLAQSKAFDNTGLSRTFLAGGTET